MSFRFIIFIATRYFRAKRRNRKIASSLFSVAGISVGVMTLVVVIAVMNGFQLSFIEPILEVKSYHLQISPASSPLPAGTMAAIKNLEGVRSVVPFIEMQSIVGTNRPCIIRGIPLDTVAEDAGFASAFSEESDTPDRVYLSGENAIVIGFQLAEQLHLRVGDTISVFTFAGSSFNSMLPTGRELTVSGIFRTWFYEIDLSWAFVSLDTAQAINASSAPIYGVKLDSRFTEQQVMENIKPILAGAGLSAAQASVQSWRDFNRVFFGALRTEKALMMFLIGLIFVVVGFNIYHSLKKSVYERLEEIATLKALGASAGVVRNIFISEGFMIGFVGGILGMLAGLLLSENINPFFRLVEIITNTFLFPLIEKLLAPLAGRIKLPPVYIFSPEVFYLKEVPVRVFLHEVLLVSLFALLCSSLAAFFAARRITAVKPVAILRYD